MNAQRKRLMAVFVAMATTLLVASPDVAEARPRADACSGILHSTKTGLRLGGGRGESEGICLIRKADESKVLAACSVERRCRIEGMFDECKDSGECAEIVAITSVRRN